MIISFKASGPMWLPPWIIKSTTSGQKSNSTESLPNYIIVFNDNYSMSYLFQETDFYSNAVRIEQDLTQANSWCEIDAIQITGSYLATSAPPTDGEINHTSTSPTVTDGEMEPSPTPTTFTAGHIDHSSGSPPPATNEIDQWISNVISFSSQYNDFGWDICH